MIRSRDFLTWVETVTGISKLLYDSDYVGGGTTRTSTGKTSILTSTSTITPRGGCTGG